MANIINITDEKYNMALAALNSGIKIKKPTVSTLNDIVKYVYSQLVPGFVRCGLLPKEFEDPLPPGSGGRSTADTARPVGTR